MTLLLTWAATGMAVVFAALLAAIVVRRFRADRRRARDLAMRPALEALLGEYLAAEQQEQPSLPAGRESRDLIRTIALEAMAELRGREHSRLVTLLEVSGIVAETVAGLASRRPRVRRAAAEALRQIGSETSVRPLSVGLEDPDLDAALTCAAALAELSDDSSIPRMLTLADRAAVARPGAVAAILVTLGRRHPTAIGDALLPEASIALRRLAAAVAGELRLAEHVPALREALGGADAELAARGARGLGLIGDEGAFAALAATVDDDERVWFLRLAATEALGEIGDARAVPPLERELNADQWVLQAKAAKALRLLGAGGERALRRALASPTETVREHARVALER